MAETLNISGTYSQGDDRYWRVRLPSGEVVGVPRTTGFSFIDRQLAPPSASHGDTLVAERKLLFEPRPEVKAWMIADALKKGDIPSEAIPAALAGMQCFLTALKDNPGLVLTPSKYVDSMWHRNMMRPGDYLQACEKAGAFIDHVPNGSDGSRPPGALDVEQTYQFLVDNSYEPDPVAWPVDETGGSCGGRDCTGGDCTSGGPARFLALPIMNGMVELNT